MISPRHEIDEHEQSHPVILAPVPQRTAVVPIETRSEISRNTQSSNRKQSRGRKQKKEQVVEDIEESMMIDDNIITSHADIDPQNHETIDPLSLHDQEHETMDTNDNQSIDNQIETEVAENPEPFFCVSGISNLGIGINV